MYKTTYNPGDWAVICDVCGFKIKASESRHRWDGLIVCKNDWEVRHPADFRKTTVEKIGVPWSQPEPATDQELVVCYLWENSSYADLATADCATADTTTQTYAFLLALKNGTG